MSSLRTLETGQTLFPIAHFSIFSFGVLYLTVLYSTRITCHVREYRPMLKKSSKTDRIRQNSITETSISWPIMHAYMGVVSLAVVVYERLATGSLPEASTVARPLSSKVKSCPAVVPRGPRYELLTPNPDVQRSHDAPSCQHCAFMARTWTE